jgi:hypothetical protein
VVIISAGGLDLNGDSDVDFQITEHQNVENRMTCRVYLTPSRHLPAMVRCLPEVIVFILFWIKMMLKTNCNTGYLTCLNVRTYVCHLVFTNVHRCVQNW